MTIFSLDGQGKFILVVLIVVGVVLGGLVALQAAWALVRMLLPADPPLAVVRAVGEALTAALRQQQPLDVFLRPVQTQVRWPYTWRIARCLDAWSAGDHADIVGELARQRLLPLSCLRNGLAAEAAGPAALAVWLDSIGREADASGNDRRIARYAVACVLIGALLAVAFLPMFLAHLDRVTNELAMVVDPSSRRFLDLIGWLGEHRLLSGWIVVVSLWIAGLALSSWRWRSHRRLERGTIILAGVASARSEAQLAVDLGLGDPSAAAIDFAALCAACGWRARSPQDLAAAVARAQDLRQRRQRRLWLAARVAIPLLFAIPVAWAATSIFGVLIQIITYLAGAIT